MFRKVLRFFFFFNDTATTEIYPLSLHDALPIFYSTFVPARSAQLSVNGEAATAAVFPMDRFGKPASSCCLAWSETRSEEHTSELQSQSNLVCRLLLEKKKISSTYDQSWPACTCY